MIAVGTIVVMVLAVLGWFQLRDRIADQGAQAAETCVEGDRVVPVTVDPDIAAPLTELAERYTDTGPVVRDHCVSVTVSPASSEAVEVALGSGAPWDSAALGAYPALWIPSSSDFLTGLPLGTVDGTPRSVASTPVVLAGTEQLTSALTAAGVGWTDLPRLQSAQDGLDALGLAQWGGLRMQLPLGPDSDATSAALAAVAATATDVARGEPTADSFRSAPVVDALSELARTDRGTSAVTQEATAAALTRLAGKTGADAEFHVVPVTEQQLRTHAPGNLTAFVPAGAKPVADHPAAILTGTTPDETLGRTAAQFVDFVRQPANAQLLTDAGFQLDVSPSEAPRMQPEARGALLDIVRNPATEIRATVLLDVSGSMDTPEGGQTRLQNTATALARQFETVVDGTELGLWAYSDNLDGDRAYRTIVPTGPVAAPFATGTRRAELVAALGALRPETATSTYEAVRAAYAAALDGFAPGRPNRLLLVTDGPNDDVSVSSDEFLRGVADAVDANRPVAVDIVSIGTNPDARTLQSLSDMTGGSFTTVGSSEGPELSDLFRKLLY